MATKKAEDDRQWDMPSPGRQRWLIARAIRNTTAEVPSMEKSEYNKFGQYDYVSIDTFYKSVKGIAAKHGLHWTVKEKSIEYHPGKSGGKDVLYAKCVYMINVTVDTADEFADYPDYDQSTVYIPHSGGQGAGISRSFAEKAWMRSTFKLVTGEADADHTAPIPAAQTTEEAPGVDDESVVKEFLARVETAKDQNDLDSILKPYFQWMGTLKRRDEMLWKRCADAAKIKRHQLDNPEPKEEIDENHQPDTGPED